MRAHFIPRVASAWVTVSCTTFLSTDMSRATFSIRGGFFMTLLHLYLSLLWAHERLTHRVPRTMRPLFWHNQGREIAVVARYQLIRATLLYLRCDTGLNTSYPYHRPFPTKTVPKNHCTPVQPDH